MRGAITLLPNTPSWRGAQLKQHRKDFTSNFYWLYTGWYFVLLVSGYLPSYLCCDRPSTYGQRLNKHVIKYQCLLSSVT